jgi:1-acyl-sn-glycerol-3-phosphate acyltransferase
MHVETHNALPDPRDSKRFFLENTTTRKILTASVRFGFYFISKIETSGVGYFPAAGPVVMVANHLTEYDVFPIQFVLPRLIFFMGKAELFANPLVDPIFRRLGGFPVHRGEKDEWAARYSLRVLEKGDVLGIFPEGKRSRGHGLHTGKTGAARFALAARAPIIPVGVEGTDEMFKYFPRRTPVHVRVGEPIHAMPGEAPIELTDRMMFALADLLPRRLRGVYSQRPPGF